MREYEAILIVHPELGEEGLSKVKAQLADLLRRLEGRVVETTVVGKRKLTYPIARKKEGIYLQMKLELKPSEAANLEKGVGMMESTVRFLLYRPTGASSGFSQQEMETSGVQHESKGQPEDG